MKDSILNLLHKELIGKSIRVQVYGKTILDSCHKRIKKSNNVSDEQFNSGNPKYSYIQKQNVIIGYHAKYETFTIVDFKLQNGGEYNEIYSYITLSNGEIYSFDDYFETPIEDIIINNNLITKF